MSMTSAAWYLQNSIMSMTSAVWYLQKVDQCARLAGSATELSQRCRHESDRRAWLQILADAIGTDMESLEAVIAQEARLALTGPDNQIDCRLSRGLLLCRV